MSRDPFSFNNPYLITRSLYPENQETPIHFIPSNHTPDHLFFRRNHFPYPTLNQSRFWIPIGGSVLNPTIFSNYDLLKLPSKTVNTVLECAGNKRNFFEPNVFGEQWEKGATSMGKWKGVSLGTLFEITGLEKDAKEVIVEGYDYGNRTDLDQIYTYTRSLPLEKALHPDTIIAYEYNDKPIPFKHGFPFRLVVPNWYAMASVKWIKQINIINTTFEGPFQTVDYVYYPKKENDEGSFLVTINNVNSTIQQPLHMEKLETGRHMIKGIAWTGKGEITTVEISTDGGETWSNAAIAHTDGVHDYTWSTWSFDWMVSEKGEFTILSRARDSYDRVQPPNPFWNQKGYGYNAIDQIKVKVE
ncbi:sulfite oxidase [Virgibacillus byunsanensis]|uniref:Sulfite oxidase n=1 Tax=Virgibacillus byunsanensis TaxID=570945 RepID=A0ABW3LPW2_9BACI